MSDYDLPAYFDVHGVSFELTTVSGASHVKEVAKRLLGDWNFFASSPAAPPSLRVSLSDWEPVPSRPRRVFATQMGEARGWMINRICLYGDAAWVSRRQMGAALEVQIFGKDLNSLYEAAHVTLLSIVGEELDKRGFHRVHALGLEIQGQAWLITGPSGGGKSSLAYQVLQNTNWKIFSDETPLWKDRKIFAFPLRLSLADSVVKALGGEPGRYPLFHRRIYSGKRLIPIPAHRVAPAAPLAGWIRLESSKASVLNPLLDFVDLISGRGYAQMAEQILRGDNILTLSQTAVSRSRMAWELQNNPIRRLNLTRQSDAQVLFENLQKLLKRENLSS